MDKMMSFEEERQYLAKKRILFALAKSLSIGGLCFSMSMFLTCIVFAYENLTMDPVMILKMWITFFVLTIYTFIRIWVGTSKWAMNKPFILLNVMFMPLYLVTVLIFAMDLTNGLYGNDRWKVLVLYAVLFLCTFSIKQLIDYLRYKAKTNVMNDALNDFLKEHEWDEKE